MKKVLAIFILLLLAVPAMATITVTATCSGTASPFTVTVSYTASTASEVPRAFGLTISTSAGTIGTVTPVTTHYYVAPGTFAYDGSQVTSWGNPIVNKTNTSFIYEAGSLYASNDPSHTTQPPLTGTLLSFPLTLASGSATISIAAESARGGVVREDPSVTTPAPTLTGCVATATQPLCFPSTTDYTNQFNAFKSYKSYVPSWDGACWCGAAPASPVSSQWRYQCSGDIDGTTEGLTKYRVYNTDYARLVANWKKVITDPTINPCADIDHKSEGLTKYRVYNNDYNRLVANWKKKDTDMGGNCPRPDAQNP